MIKYGQHIHERTRSRILFTLRWKTSCAIHEDEYLFEVNLCRDILPDPLLRQILGRKSGDRLEITFQAGELVPPYEKGRRLTLPCFRFRRDFLPAFGRFYPQGLLRDIPGVYPETITPFRCVETDSESFDADLNHPFALHSATISATVLAVQEFDDLRGGTLQDIVELLCDGPGMQTRWGERPTDFFRDSDAVFRRDDENADSAFYAEPRLVTHVDDQAVENIKKVYGRLLQPGSKVLDLMAGWKSHIPEGLELDALVGLGMNDREMEANSRLTAHTVHDLNQDPYLPYENGHFDAVICTVSVEYLTRPLEVFSEVARVLRPQGIFVLTFSHRWFPPKVISLWRDLHPFERVGLVTEYLLGTGRFSNLTTLSIRGWPRPEHDRYYPRLKDSDPVFAVWGYTHGGTD